MNKNFEFLFKIITLISGASVELEKKRRGPFLREI